MTFGFQNVPRGQGVTVLGLFPKFYLFFGGFPYLMCTGYNFHLLVCTPPENNNQDSPIWSAPTHRSTTSSTSKSCLWRKRGQQRWRWWPDITRMPRTCFCRQLEETLSYQNEIEFTQRRKHKENIIGSLFYRQQTNQDQGAKKTCCFRPVWFLERSSSTSTSTSGRGRWTLLLRCKQITAVKIL